MKEAGRQAEEPDFGCDSSDVDFDALPPPETPPRTATPRTSLSCVLLLLILLPLVLRVLLFLLLLVLLLLLLIVLLLLVLRVPYYSSSASCCVFPGLEWGGAWRGDDLKKAMASRPPGRCPTLEKYLVKLNRCVTLQCHES